MAAIDTVRSVLKAVGRALGLFGGVAGAAHAVDLPADRAEFMYHLYDGDGAKASGPALLVRKSLFDKVSLSASYYVDAVSNASIDVVTTASHYSETRQQVDLGVEYAVRDSLIRLSASRGTEPDYTANTFGLDVSSELPGPTVERRGRQVEVLGAPGGVFEPAVDGAARNVEP